MPQIEAFEQHLLENFSLTVAVANSNQTTYKPGTEPSIQQTYHWLSRLARQLQQGNTKKFLIERMQPSWLATPTQKRLYQITIGLITGLIVALIYGGTTGLIGASIGGISYGIILGCTQRIYPVPCLTFSLEFAQKRLFFSLLEGLGWGLIYGIIDVLVCGLIWGLEGVIIGMTDSLVWGLIEGIIWGLFVPGFCSRTVSNQEIRESAFNAGIFTIIGGVSWVLLYIGALLILGEPLEPHDLLIDGIGNGVFFGIYIGGLACVQHFVLRLILKHSDAIPWNYAKFLNYATELGFLEREGAYYQFIDDSVQEYLAKLDEASQAD